MMLSLGAAYMSVTVQADAPVTSLKSQGVGQKQKRRKKKTGLFFFLMRSILCFQHASYSMFVSAITD